MATTNFTSGTVIASDWLNDVDAVVYGTGSSTGSLEASQVSYTPSGTGAVATTVQTKLRESVRVEDFGAVGNGVTSDATAFTKAAAVGKPIKLMSGKNYIIKRQILQNKEKIKKAKTKLNEALKEKDEFFGFCLEDFVEKKMNERFIFNSFFKDKHLKEKAFTEDEFDILPEVEIGRLVAVLNEFFIDFGHNQIKRISATPFYMSIFSLSDDNPFYFFGKPISQDRKSTRLNSSHT